MIKRVFDVVLSLLGLAFLLPIVPIIGFLIKLDSKGPVFYQTDRIGKNMAKFKMYKFRTMLHTYVNVGESICPQCDPRVTCFGRFLRRSKLNELPQLFNILKGQMTFVGPRPEAPDLAKLYPESTKRIFSVKPGLVSPATILGRNEEECYPPGVDLKSYYVNNILPFKLAVDLKYIDNQSIFKDLIYIVLGVKETVIGSISKNYVYENRSQLFLLIADLFFTVFLCLFVIRLHVDIFFESVGIKQKLLFVLLYCTVRMSFYIYFGMYNALIPYMSFYDINRVIVACFLSSIFLCFSSNIFNFDDYPPITAFFDNLILTTILAGMRLVLRLYWKNRRSHYKNLKKRRVLIYGADDWGYIASTIFSSNELCPYQTIGFLDDNMEKFGKRINGAKVLGNRHHTKQLVKLYRIEEIIITAQNANSINLQVISGICQKLNVKCRILPFFDNVIDQNLMPLSIRKLELSDILPPKTISDDKKPFKDIISRETQKAIAKP